MRVALASEAGRPGERGDDWAGATAAGVAVVLDGLTEDGPTGCVHGTGWYVHHLGTRLLTLAGEPARPLTDLLAAAIGDVTRLHGDSCDLTHPGSPAATVAMLRPRGPGSYEYLVLSDAVALFDTGPEPLVVTDRRVLAHLPELSAPAVGGTPEALTRLIQAQQRIRNRPGGYWVAQHDPGAARHAVSGTVDGAGGAALLTDGAAVAVVEFAALTWRELLDVAYERGPGDIITMTREIESRDEDRLVWPRFKTHDDATLVILR
jgi:hypothetical protein